MAQMYRAVPIQLNGNTLTLATSAPENITVADELRTFLGRDINLVVCTEHEIEKMLEEFYDSGRETIERIVADLADDIALKEQIDALTSGPIDLTSAESLADSVPVRKLLNMVLLFAIKDHASDVTLNLLKMNFESASKPMVCCTKWFHPLVTWHLPSPPIKVMANLDIAERRLPQDGRIELVVGGHPVDLRVSVLPTMFGESVVMRVLTAVLSHLISATLAWTKKRLSNSETSSKNQTASFWLPGQPVQVKPPRSIPPYQNSTPLTRN